MKTTGSSTKIAAPLSTRCETAKGVPWDFKSNPPKAFRRGNRRGRSEARTFRRLNHHPTSLMTDVCNQPSSIGSDLELRIPDRPLIPLANKHLHYITLFPESGGRSGEVEGSSLWNESEFPKCAPEQHNKGILPPATVH